MYLPTVKQISIWETVDIIHSIWISIACAVNKSVKITSYLLEITLRKFSFVRSLQNIHGIITTDVSDVIRHSKNMVTCN